MLVVALARYIAANVAGCDFDETGVTGNGFIATMPSAPDLCWALFPSGGIPWAGHGSIATDEPTIQLRVRSVPFDPRPGLDLADAIYRQVVGLHRSTLDPGGDAEVHVSRTLALQTGPVSIGADKNNRPEFTVNFAHRIQAPSAHRN